MVPGLPAAGGPLDQRAPGGGWLQDAAAPRAGGGGGPRRAAGAAAGHRRGAGRPPQRGPRPLARTRGRAGLGSTFTCYCYTEISR